MTGVMFVVLLVDTLDLVEVGVVNVSVSSPVISVEGKVGQFSNGDFVGNGGVVTVVKGGRIGVNDVLDIKDLNVVDGKRAWRVLGWEFNKSTLDAHPISVARAQQTVRQRPHRRILAKWAMALSSSKSMGQFWPNDTHTATGE